MTARMQRRRERLKVKGWLPVTVDLSPKGWEALQAVQRFGATQAEAIEGALVLTARDQRKIAPGWRTD